MNADKIGLVLADVLDAPADPTADDQRRLAALAASTIAAVYLPELRAIRAELSATPGDKGTPALTAALAAANRDHDDYGRAFWFAAMGVLADPGASEAAKTAAAKCLATFVPARGELAQDTATEIASARRRAPQVAALADDLDRIPAADGRTARALVDAQHAAAERRASLTAERARVPAPAPLDGARWTRAWGLLLEFRRALQREVAQNEALPRDLDRLVFGLMDRLAGG
ncbi:MAG: hypothetical protein R3F60_02205 [bacterium]